MQHKRRVNPPRSFGVGQKLGDGANIRGGGGPENAGAISSGVNPNPTTQTQPSWYWEEASTFGEYTGPAHPSKTPNVAGIPANNFRALGDSHGGRG